MKVNKSPDTSSNMDHDAIQAQYPVTHMWLEELLASHFGALPRWVDEAVFRRDTLEDWFDILVGIVAEGGDTFGNDTVFVMLSSTWLDLSASGGMDGKYEPVPIPDAVAHELHKSPE